VKAASWLGILLLAGCSAAGGDRERRGDVAWHEARWSDAINDYRASGDSPRVLAKLADALLQSGALLESAEAWTKLGAEAPDRADEAAAALNRVAELAAQDGREAPLVAAILGLRRVAPLWPVGRLAGRLGRTTGTSADRNADLVPALLASMQGRAAADPLLLRLGQADRARGACDAAIPLLEGVMRRTASGEVHDSASVTLGWCELATAMNALQAQRNGEAELWFVRAAHRDAASAVGRRAQLGLGDARIAQGDTVGARTAWQEVAAAAPADSVSQLALTRLSQLTPSVTVDTNIPHPVRP
jgi:hypothetical protein